MRNPFPVKTQGSSSSKVSRGDVDAVIVRVYSKIHRKISLSERIGNCHPGIASLGRFLLSRIGIDCFVKDNPAIGMLSDSDLLDKTDILGDFFERAAKLNHGKTGDTGKRYHGDDADNDYHHNKLNKGKSAGKGFLFYPKVHNYFILCCLRVNSKQKRQKNITKRGIYGIVSFTMAEKQKNIMEDIARDFIKHSLTMRYDICTCGQCKEDMVASALTTLPVENVPLQAVSASLIDETKLKYKAELARAMFNAIDMVSKNPSHKLTEDRIESFRLLLNNILEDRGLDFRQYNQGVIRRKVGYRMHMNGVSSYGEYARFLRKSPDEYEKMLEALCINVTEFFRDMEVWVTIRYLLETLINQKKLKGHNTLRIWSAGCSSGEEPYSLAIVLKELLKAGLKNFSFELYATDIDKKCLLMASDGVYPKNNLKNVEEKYLKSYFTLLGDGNYRIKEEIKNMVKFQYLDLIKQDFLRETDVIVCRNVFIYFNRELQEQLLKKFYFSLCPGGYLIKGKAETIINEASGYHFEDVDTNARIYRKLIPTDSLVK